MKNIRKYYTTGERIQFTVFYHIMIALLCSHPLYSQSLSQGASTVCMDCHLDIDVPYLTDPVTESREMEDGRLIDVHARAGFSCHHCHGGNPHDIDRAKDPAEGYTGKPDPTTGVAMCASCHGDIEFMRSFNPRMPTDQYRLYLTSEHGKLLMEGDTKAATCVSCHGVHQIRPGSDPISPVYPVNIPSMCAECHSDPEYMGEYRIPTNQLETYKRSEHSRLLFEEGDIGAPVCNTCHGNHGAVPPLVADVHHVCGQCHAQHDEYFMQSTHAVFFEEMGMPGCATCHGYHEIPSPTTAELLSNEPGSTCMMCHQVNDHCFIYVETIGNLFEKTERRMEETEELLKRAEVMGMGVQQAQFQLAEVRDHFIRARIRVHQFEAGPVEEELEQALEIIRIAHDFGEDAVREWQMRRVGLAISLFFIALLVIGLVMKIKMRSQ